jgi:hypothetical protein
MDSMDMNEQKFVPESQEQQPLDEHEIELPVQPYYWSTKPDAPKDEPASLYDDPMVESNDQADYQQGYTAQNSANSQYYGGYSPNQPPLRDAQDTAQKIGQGAQGQQTSARARYSRQQYSSDGNSFGQGYTYRQNAGNNQQWNVPLWAQPQRQVGRGNPARWIWILIIGIMFIGPLLHLFGFLLVTAVVLLALIFPFALVALFAIPFILSRAMGRRRSWRYTRFWRMNNSPWRGPWGW